MADTLATYRGSTDLDLPMTRHSHAEGHHRARQSLLVRKLNLLPGNTAMAVAGKERPIEDFLGTAAVVLANSDDPKQAMQQLHALATEVPDLFFVAATPIGTSGEFLHTASKGIGADTQHFGRIFAVGSGSHSLVQQIGRYDKMRSSKRKASDERQNPYLVLLDLCATLSTSLLASDLLKQSTNRNNWGAYLEYCYFDFSSMTWKRAPKTLHLFYVLTPNETNIYVLKQVSHAILFDPGEEHGRLLILRGHGDELIGHEVIIQDVFAGTEGLVSPETTAIDDPVHGGLFVSKPSLEYWSAWRPHLATASISLALDGGPTFTRYATILRPGGSLRFSLSGDSIEFTCGGDEVDYVARTLCEEGGARYGGRLDGYFDLVPRD